MTIRLIQPRMGLRPMDTHIKPRMSPPLGLYVIAGLLRDEHTVIVENENVEKLSGGDADLVGISVTVDTFPRACEIAASYRAKGIPVVAGGIHVSCDPEGCAPHFDALSIGPAELVWPAIAADAGRGQLQKIYRCPRPMTGADIASPAWDMIDQRRYLYANILFTSYGCPFRCDFCYNSCSAYKGLHIRKPVKQVLREIEAMHRRHVMFIDDNFIGDIGWAREMVEGLKPLNLRWNAAVSANIADHPDLLDQMKASGCKSLFIGFESLSADAVAGVHKVQNHTDRYERLVEALHSRGIMINASFVFGLDGETPEVFDRTVDWILAHRIETVTSHILTPYPGTELYRRLRDAGRITDTDLSHYNTAHVVYTPSGMSAKELYRGYLDVYRRVYSFGGILRRIPRAREQVLPYLAFNFLYRKFGRISDLVCRLAGYGRVGVWGEKISRYI